MTIDGFVGVGLSFFVALVASSIITRIAIAYGPRWGLVDLPSPRRAHAMPTPRGGGVAIFAGTAISIGLFSTVAANKTEASPFGSMYWGLASAVFLLGLADDIRPLSWTIRLAVQVVVAAAATWSAPEMAWWMRVAGTLWLVGMLNAFNMLDNMDALSAGLAVIAGGGLMLVSGAIGFYGALIGALAGFLFFNWPPARIFMGDCGSTFLGFTIGLGALHFATSGRGPGWRLLVPLCICAVPIYDLVTVVLLRLGQGRSPFQADRQHSSHRLVARGLSSPAAVRVIQGMALVSGGVGVVLYFLESWNGVLVVFGVFVAFWIGMVVMEFVLARVPRTAS